TIAYQGARGGDPLEIRRMNEAIAPKPDLALLIDFDPEIALTRIRQSRGDVPNEFERVDQLQAIRAIFLELAADDPAVFRIIDGNQSPDEVFAALITATREAIRGPSRA